MASLKKISILFVCLVLSACAFAATKKDVFSIVAEADQAYDENRWLEASRLYKQITQRVPKDHYAWFRLGNTELRQGRLTSAIYNYQQALERAPNNAKAHYNLALAYLLQAQQQMQRANASLRDDDPGKTVVADRLQALQKLIDQPIEYSLTPGGQSIAQ